MRTLPLILLWVTLLASAAGCRPRAQKEEFLPLAHAFLRAAAQGDSATLMQMAASIEPVNRALAIRLSDAQLLDKAATDLEWRGGDVVSDSAHTFYTIKATRTPEELGVNFVRQGSTWKVYWIGLVSR